MLKATIPAAMITAPGSGQGKSMVTAALARLHRNAGRKVRVFKHGPDYLDPMVLEVASGQPVYQLHPWMTGEDECRWRLAEAARDADLILVEGSMGLFDGDPSSGDLAKLAGIPALPVINASGMAQTFGAVALGLASFDPDLPVYQVIANQIGSPYHGELLQQSLPDGIRLLGAIPRNEAMSIPDRHLGLVQAGELADLEQRLDDAARVLAEAGLDGLPDPVTLEAPAPQPPPRLLEGVRIAIARDAAFSFIYRANLDLLAAMGAELSYFSPLTDSAVPAADALWLPGATRSCTPHPGGQYADAGRHPFLPPGRQADARRVRWPDGLCHRAGGQRWPGASDDRPAARAGRHGRPAAGAGAAEPAHAPGRTARPHLSPLHPGHALATAGPCPQAGRHGG